MPGGSSSTLWFTNPYARGKRRTDQVVQPSHAYSSNGRSHSLSPLMSENTRGTREGSLEPRASIREHVHLCVPTRALSARVSAIPWP